MKKPLLAAGLSVLFSMSAAFATGAWAQQTVLKLNSPAPPGSFLHGKVIEPWIKAVEQDAGGALKFETFYGGALGNFLVTYDRVIDGVADVGWTLPSLTGGKHNQQGVAALPFETLNANEAAEALWRIFEKGVTAQEFNQVKLLGLWAFPNSALHTRTPVAKIADVQGKKFAIPSAIAGKTIIALGATPVTLPPNQVYQAISRGITDGALMPFTGMATFKIQEVAGKHLDVALGADSAMFFMNKAKYDALPAPAKAAIDKHSYLSFSQKLGAESQAEADRGRELVKANVSTLAPAEEAEWKKAMTPVVTEWAQTTIDGAKVLEAFRAEITAIRARK
ncbi:MAG: C4-dicarboxylate transporter [Hyphomicrobiales bacterium]|nr:C4-dicarboxylate transporter [Hyphomicrobiales bacterium]